MKQRFPEKQVLTRYLFIEAIFFIIGIGIIAKTAYIMFVERGYWKQVNSRFEKSQVVIPPSRGNIYSADGQLLAATLPEYKIFMDYMVVEKDSVRRLKYQHEKDSLFYTKVDSLSSGLHHLFPDISVSAFRKRLVEGRVKEKRHWPIYDRRITYLQFKAVSQLPFLSLRQSGFHWERSEQRTNPFGSLALRTIGRLYAGKDTARFGLELSYDSVLRGKPGMGHREKSGSSYVTRISVEPENGCDIVTTIDVGMQDLAEKSLVSKLKEINAAEGVAMLMEVKTGDVKAIVNMTRDKNGQYHEEKNYAVSNLLEPGSVFKTASFMVAFDDGYLHPGDMVNTGNGKVLMHGRYMKDANWRNMGNGVITAAECIQKSSNIGVSTLIDKYYFNQPAKFVDGLYRVGIASDLHVPIPGYAKPYIRRPKPDGSNWSKTALAWMSIGYETQVPPISTLSFYNGIANGGRMMYPRFVIAKKRGGEFIAEYPTRVVRERMCSPEALSDIKSCLNLVVSKGTGRKAGSPYFQVAGKTGTAQIWTKNGRTPSYLVTFVGYFPADDPQYTCIVCIKKTPPASGGSQCGPVFRRIAEGVMARHRKDDLNSARDTLHGHQPHILNGNMRAARYVLSELQVPYTAEGIDRNAWGKARTDSNGVTLTSVPPRRGVVPDVHGMGLRDALYMLERSGMRVSLEGVGKVVAQSVPAGSALRKGMRINIVLRTSDEDAEATSPDAAGTANAAATPSAGSGGENSAAAPESHNSSAAAESGSGTKAGQTTTQDKSGAKEHKATTVKEKSSAGSSSQGTEKNRSTRRNSEGTLRSSDDRSDKSARSSKSSSSGSKSSSKSSASSSGNSKSTAKSSKNSSGSSKTTTKSDKKRR